jgi:prevent-host-death family protein
MDVGIREFKAKLSEYLDRAANGEDIIVTDRGRPVVRLVPVGSVDPLERGVDEGWVDPPRRTGLGPAQRFRSTASVLETLESDRG